MDTDFVLQLFINVARSFWFFILNCKHVRMSTWPRTEIMGAIRLYLLIGVAKGPFL